MSSFKNPNLPFLLSEYPDLGNFDKELLRQLNEIMRNLDAILQRGIRFQDNVDARLIPFTSSATPDAENTVPHLLGKVPTGYLVYSKDKAGDLYNGTTAWTKTNLYVKSPIATVAFKIIVF